MANQVFTDGCVMTNVVGDKYLRNTAAEYLAGQGRFGTAALHVFGGSSVGISFPGRPVTLVAGFAWNPPNVNHTVCAFFDSVANNTQIGLQYLADGTLQFFRGSTSTLLGTKSTQSFLPNNHNQLEMKVSIDGTVGTLECRLNGNPTPILTFTGNTKNTANTWIDQVTFNDNQMYSDIYIFDTNGAAPNNFLGNKRIYTILPNADSASAGLNQFQSNPVKTAGNHFQNVNETPSNGDTSYNFSGTSGQRESYKVQSLPLNVNNVSLVNTWAKMRIDDANPISTKLTARSNSVDSVSSAINVAASYTAYSAPFPVDPNTNSAWSTNAVNNMEIGVQIV